MCLAAVERSEPVDPQFRSFDYRSSARSSTVAATSTATANAIAFTADSGGPETRSAEPDSRTAGLLTALA